MATQNRHWQWQPHCKTGAVSAFYTTSSSTCDAEDDDKEETEESLCKACSQSASTSTYWLRRQHELPHLATFSAAEKGASAIGNLLAGLLHVLEAFFPQKVYCWVLNALFRGVRLCARGCVRLSGCLQFMCLPVCQFMCHVSLSLPV